MQWEGGVCCICLTLDIFMMQDGVTAMYFAAQYNHPRLVELLLAHGVGINKVQHYVANVKMVCSGGASINNHIEVARFLVEHGASINYQNQVS